MTNKFTPTFADKLKKINNEMIANKELKRKQLEDTYIPDSLKKVLTPEEVSRASKSGVIVGYIAMLMVVVGIGLIILHWGGII